MPNRLTRPGALAYALIAASLGYQTVRLIRLDTAWEAGPTWAGATLVGIVLASGILFAASAITRIPLVGSYDPEADDDHLLSRRGAAAVIGLTALAVLVVMVSSFEGFGVWPASPAVFVPFWVRKLEASYFEGVEETRRAAAAARAEDR